MLSSILVAEAVLITAATGIVVVKITAVVVIIMTAAVVVIVVAAAVFSDVATDTVVARTVSATSAASANILTRSCAIAASPLCCVRSVGISSSSSGTSTAAFGQTCGG
jgi:hypothetical protein